MNRMLPVIALALSLSTGWWGTIVHATASALGFYPQASIEHSVPPPPPPDGSTTQSGCSWDPLGCPEG